MTASGLGKIKTSSRITLLLYIFRLEGNVQLILIYVAFFLAFVFTI